MSSYKNEYGIKGKTALNSFRIKLADVVIDVSTTFHRAYNVCKDFIINEKEDVSVKTDLSDIRVEAEKTEKELNVDAPSNVHLEVVTLLRKIADILIDYDTILMHGAAIGFESEGYLFSAPSGTGKTTHIYKWLERIPNVFVVNGDKPFIRIYDNGDRPLVCGSPWAGKENLYTNIMIPLKAIILMERSEINHIEQITFNEAFPLLYQQVYHPDDPVKIIKTLYLVKRLQPDVSFWRFKCNNFKDDCFETAFRALIS